MRQLMYFMKAVLRKQGTKLSKFFGYFCLFEMFLFSDASFLAKFVLTLFSLILICTFNHKVYYVSYCSYVYG